MHRKKHLKQTIGIVLSSTPGYSETFFRNKIKGLQDSGYNVVLFVNNKNKVDFQISCEVVNSVDLSGGFLKRCFNSFLVIFKSLFIHPSRSFSLFQLEKKDGMPFKKIVRNLILNEFLLTKNLDWLHFGFGMLAHDRENIAEAIGAKMAVSFRGFDLYLSPFKHKYCYDRLFKKEVKYHVLSQRMKAILIEKGRQENDIFVISPAIDINQFSRSKPQNKQDVISIVTIARMHWVKGLEYTFQALSLLKKQGVKFKFKLIGSGEERERLIFTAHQLGIYEDINFVGKISHEEVNEHIEQSDIYLQYSIQEGFCNAVLEAQAMGLLCIVSNADGLKENVLDGKTGWVVPRRQPKLLAEKIEKVIHLSINEKQKIRNNAINRVQNEFNLIKQNTLFAEFYSN